jgi:glutamate decarboxylase
MVDAFSKNFIDYEEYPVSADIQNRCVSMLARLFNCPTHGDANAVGTSTIGSSEGIMLGVLAMKKLWANKRKAEGKPYDNPNIIMNSAVQVCWEKAARYFDVEERYVYCTEERYVIDPQEAIDLIDENTIGICAILGTTYTGEYVSPSQDNLKPFTNPPADTKTSKPSTTSSSRKTSTSPSTSTPPPAASSSPS